MKKGPLILLVAICSLTMSVAANSKASRTSVCVVDDVGDTKVGKKVEIVDVINASIEMKYAQLDVIANAAVLENVESVVIKPVSLNYDVVKIERSKKLHILNCCIKQCSYRAGAPV